MPLLQKASLVPLPKVLQVAIRSATAAAALGRLRSRALRSTRRGRRDDAATLSTSDAGESERAESRGLKEICEVFCDVF